MTDSDRPELPPHLQKMLHILREHTGELTPNKNEQDILNRCIDDIESDLQDALELDPELLAPSKELSDIEKYLLDLRRNYGRDPLGQEAYAREKAAAEALRSQADDCESEDPEDPEPSECVTEEFDAFADEEFDEFPEELDEEHDEEPQEDLPEQGPLVGKYVDVMEPNGERIGIGKCLREDFGHPWQNKVVMIIPPFQREEILENKRLSLCPTQQIGDL